MTQEGNALKKPPPGWRFNLGLFFFILGWVCPLFIPLVASTKLPVAWKATISGLLGLGIPEFLWVAAAAIMGKSGFNYLKMRFIGFFKKYAPPDTVSRTRYRIGLVMFTAPILFGWLGPYIQQWIPGYENHRFIVNVMGDLIFISSLFVLGGDFWDKLRSLFVYDARAHIPGLKK